MYERELQLGISLPLSGSAAADGAPTAVRRLGGGSRRGGFSLVELVVSIGILTLMMLLASQVFKISVDTTGEAQALIEINQSLRLLEETLREDLAGVNPDRSLMVIQGNKINAFWKREHLETSPSGDASLGSYSYEPDPERMTMGANPTLIEPRADLLMFFTSRPVTSAIAPTVSSNHALVIYGHAEPGELNKNGDWVQDPVQFSTNPIYPIPAEEWHLARRATLVVDAPESSIISELPYRTYLDLRNMAVNTTDVVPNVPAETDAIYQSQQMPLAEGVIDIIAQNTGGTLFFDAAVVNPPTGPAWSWLSTQWIRRSRMDLTPPSRYANRLGAYFLENCASFKVEWGFTDPTVSGVNHEILWVDPANIAGSVMAACFAAVPGMGNNTFPLNQFSTLSLPPGRFVDNEPNPVPPVPPALDWSHRTTHAFLARDWAGARPNDPDPWFPKVLRITVDLYDPAGNLDRPIRHVMVLPVGSAEG